MRSETKTGALSAGNHVQLVSDQSSYRLYNSRTIIRSILCLVAGLNDNYSQHAGCWPFMIVGWGAAALFSETRDTRDCIKPRIEAHDP